ncbi:MAG: 16S rRNA (adenine(1518)-N(6)/adenine(1519)-N(6))-dimethyltransferase RsmA [Pseudomonadales bacterium]|jgi:16S rRNA (adenine1518-N6/adenine1519-N6)-dimethyltransferase|nr:16S rRNA (adenine(1518)-N(6)/adenine(1519)-N(6))-dimethyltransferase RsmA [Pseudomonadales bacterium]
MSAKKRFGQNFLHSSRVIEDIISAVAPRQNETILEIGPGRGSLTRLLAERTANLIAIEIDRDLIPLLKKQLPSGVNIINADILDYPIDDLPTPLRVVGNLPYNISTPLLFRLFEYCERLTDMTLMLQAEVVDRMVAAPGSRVYGRLSVMTQYYCQIEKLMAVPASAFTPRPKVESAVARLQPHKTKLAEAENLAVLSKILIQAFGQRRKTIRNSLSGCLNADELRSIGLDPKLRAENLSVENYTDCANFVSRRDQ